MGEQELLRNKKTPKPTGGQVQKAHKRKELGLSVLIQTL